MLITGTSLSYCAKRCSIITNIDATKRAATASKVNKICIALFCGKN